MKHETQGIWFVKGLVTELRNWESQEKWIGAVWDEEPGNGYGATNALGAKSRQESNRDAQLRGRSAPVLPVRLRRWRARLELRGVFVAAQKFVSFNLGYDSDATRLIGFGALDADRDTEL